MLYLLLIFRYAINILVDNILKLLFSVLKEELFQLITATSNGKWKMVSKHGKDFKYRTCIELTCQTT